MKTLFKILSSKTITYIFTALALAYFLGHIFTAIFKALDRSSQDMFLGLLGALAITIFSILYTNFKNK